MRVKNIFNYPNYNKLMFISCLVVVSDPLYSFRCITDLTHTKHMGSSSEDEIGGKQPDTLSFSKPFI